MYQSHDFFFSFLTAQHVGSQFPNQGSNLQPLHWNCGVLTIGSPGKSLTIFTESYKRTFQNSYDFDLFIISLSSISVNSVLHWLFCFVFICLSDPILSQVASICINDFSQQVPFIFSQQILLFLICLDDFQIFTENFTIFAPSRTQEIRNV